MYKNTCIIQGDIRTKNIDLIINEMSKHFDKIIISTWQGEESKLPKGHYELILNQVPQNIGLTNRNFQRKSTAEGLKLAKEIGSEFILKWRTDCLPTNFDFKSLIKLSTKNVYKDFTSRIVLPAFRNLTVIPDWFSTLPDHFAFGRIKEMEMLWGDQDFDYNLDYNVPDKMFDNDEIKKVNSKIFYNNTDYTYAYDAHCELYAIFKMRLEEKLRSEITHPFIAFNFLNLINHDRLKICWFNKDENFRSIGQAYMYPWWTEKNYLNGRYKTSHVGYKIPSLDYYFGQNKSRLFVLLNKLQQGRWLSSYRKRELLGPRH